MRACMTRPQQSPAISPESTMTARGLGLVLRTRGWRHRQGDADTIQRPRDHPYIAPTTIERIEVLLGCNYDTALRIVRSISVAYAVTTCFAQVLAWVSDGEATLKMSARARRLASKVLVASHTSIM